MNAGDNNSDSKPEIEFKIPGSLSIRVAPAPEDPNERRPARSWNELVVRLNGYAIEIVEHIPLLLIDTLKGTRNLVRGLGGIFDRFGNRGRNSTVIIEPPEIPETDKEKRPKLGLPKGEIVLIDSHSSQTQLPPAREEP